ncbi:putative leucine-rich repeat-containing protein DDB_G0290503 [Eurosta solidaginis]|uniref:putative leucine-rich repeat-containing protein DDB_G0290503 n=1 Tax=Eurosta solidaginis TaxID=178769 RepID=UPI0035307C55
MGGCRCTFRDCPVGTKKLPGMHFFCYPIANKESFVRWLKLADKMDFIKLPSIVQKNKKICARHFRIECFVNYKMERLTRGKYVEPTLMPLNGKLFLDYEHEEMIGGPELVKISPPVQAHLIPSPGYVYPFTLHDNVDPNEYIKTRLIDLVLTENIIELLPATTSAALKNSGIKRILDENCELMKNSKKFKIFNSEVTNSSSSPPLSSIASRGTKKKEENVFQLDVKGSDTLVDCPIMTDESISAQPKEIETITICSKVEESEDNNEMGEEEELKDVLINMNNVEPNQNNTDPLDNLKVHDQNQMTAHINKLENELIKYKAKLKLKINELLKTESFLEEVKHEYKQLEQKYEELEKNHEEVMDETNKNNLKELLTTEIEHLQEENKHLQEKCAKYEKEKQEQKQKKVGKAAVITSQATSSSTAAEKLVIFNQQQSVTSAATNSGNVQIRHTNANLSKAQLFNGVKKYVSLSMAALLRMDMFGNADRAWKPDERRVTVDLLQLGDEIYKYVSDEWRLRLPAISEARCWRDYAVNMVKDEEDLDIIMTILDFIQNPPENNKFTALKKVLIERLSLSENAKFDKDLSDSEMGERKPSECYRSLVLLSGTNFSQEVLKKLWMRKPPRNLNVISASSNSSDINELMKLADNVWEVVNKNEIASVNNFQNSKSENTLISNLVQTTNLMYIVLEVFPDTGPILVRILIGSVNIIINSGTKLENRRTRRLCIFDRDNILNFLIDSGAEISVLSVSKFVSKKKSSDIILTAANGTTISTYGKNEEQHLQDLSILFKRLAEYGLNIKPNKCIFGFANIDFLGYNISGFGIRPSDEKIAALRNVELPKSIKHAQKFIEYTMGGCRCTFRDCPVGTKKLPGMHFFCYPIANKESFVRWLKLADKMHFIELSRSVQKNKKICARHFRIECFVNYKMDGLLRGQYVEPTLMPLNGKLFLDYEHEEMNGGPELVEIAPPVHKHLIPSPGYVYPFTLHDNVDPYDYIKTRRIDLALIGNSIELLPATTSATLKNNDIRRILNKKCLSMKNTKKFKILNSEENNSSSSPPLLSMASRVTKKKEEKVIQLDISGSGTLVDCAIMTDESSSEQSNEIETSIIWSDVEEIEDNNEMCEEQELDDVLMNDVEPNQNTTDPSDNLKVQDQNQTSEINEMSAYINKLENELIIYKAKLKLKINELLKKERLLEEVKHEYKQLEQKYEELEKNHEEVMDETNKNNLKELLTTEIEHLQEENKHLQEKCAKYENEKQEQKQNKVGKAAVITSQATSSSTAAEKLVIFNQQQSVTSAATNSCNVQIPHTNANLSKAQLFNGVKKYVSSSMAALLRMDMFGNTDRAWKPDERRVAIDLIQLGDEVYNYVSDEWRLRLPTISEARCWRDYDVNMVNDEEDL